MIPRVREISEVVIKFTQMFPFKDFVTDPALLEVNGAQTFDLQQLSRLPGGFVHGEFVKTAEE